MVVHAGGGRAEQRQGQRQRQRRRQGGGGRWAVARGGRSLLRASRTFRLPDLPSATSTSTSTSRQTVLLQCGRDAGYKGLVLQRSRWLWGCRQKGSFWRGPCTLPAER